MEDCLACALTNGDLPLPGGTIARHHGWVVEHCVGPLGVGTLVVKPERHVVALADLTSKEAQAMGQVLHRAARVVSELTRPAQVYLCLWSHAERRPSHIHFVVQPVDHAVMKRHDAHGPKLQASMLNGTTHPTLRCWRSFADRARDHGRWQ